MHVMHNTPPKMIDLDSLCLCHLSLSRADLDTWTYSDLFGVPIVVVIFKTDHILNPSEYSRVWTALLWTLVNANWVLDLMHLAGRVFLIIRLICVVDWLLLRQGIWNELPTQGIVGIPSSKNVLNFNISFLNNWHPLRTSAIGRCLDTGIS